MENMDKELTVPKRVLIVRPKIPEIPQYLYAQFVCPSPKVLDFNEKRLHWASIVRDLSQLGRADSTQHIITLPPWIFRPTYSPEKVGLAGT